MSPQKYLWVCFLGIILLMPMQGCYLFCLFKADPALEETVEHFLEHEVMEMNNPNKPH